MGRFRRVAVVLAAVSVAVVAAFEAFPSVVDASTPGAGEAALVQVAATTPSSVPQTPFVENIIPEGLGALVNWAPDQSSDDVTGYTLTATVASGFASKVSKKCAFPPVVSAAAPGTDSSALMTKLCDGIPYSISMSATNAKGNSAPSPPSILVVPLVGPAAKLSPHHLGAAT